MAHASGFWECVQTALCLAACTACVQAATRPAVVAVPVVTAATVATTATGVVEGSEGVVRASDLPLLAVSDMVRV